MPRSPIPGIGKMGFVLRQRAVCISYPQNAPGTVRILSTGPGVRALHPASVQGRSSARGSSATHDSSSQLWPDPRKRGKRSLFFLGSTLGSAPETDPAEARKAFPTVTSPSNRGARTGHSGCVLARSPRLSRSDGAGKIHGSAEILELSLQPTARAIEMPRRAIEYRTTRVISRAALLALYHSNESSTAAKPEAFQL